jgi:hypothetical protein
MFSMALMFGMLKALYVIACALLVASIVMALVSGWKGRLRNAFLLWLSSMPLFVVLWSIPRLSYYVEYGIHSKTVTYTISAHWLALLTVLIAAFVRGPAKWLPITAALLAFALISAA